MRAGSICQKSSVETSDQSYCDKLKSEWLSLTLLVVGIVTILVAQFVLFDTWRYVTMIGGGLGCALGLLGFTITPKPVEKKREGFLAFWEKVKNRSYCNYAFFHYRTLKKQYPLAERESSRGREITVALLDYAS